MRGMTGATDRPPPVAWPPSPRTARLALAGVLGAGLALRHAVGRQDALAAEWEADAFVWAWSGPQTRLLASGCRPSGLQLVWELCGRLVGGPSVAGLRWAAIGLSLLSLVCAWDLMRTVRRWRKADAGTAGSASLSLLLGWAALPALIWAGPRLVPELVSGGAMCLVAAAVLRFRLRPGWATWLWLSLSGALALAVGGAVVWVALTAGLLTYLVQLPRAPVALPLLLAWMLAIAAAVGLARVRDDSRPWRPDSGPAYALADLVDAPLLLNDHESLLAEVRADAVWRACGHALTERPATATAAALGRRGQALVSTSRFDGVPGPIAGLLGGLDAVATGVVLVLAAMTLARPADGGGSRGARVAALVAAATWLIATIAGAAGPLALSGVLLVGLAVAVGGWSGSPAPAPRAAAGLAGVLLLALAWPRPADDVPGGAAWLQQLTHVQGQGRQVVAQLVAGESRSAAESVQLSQLLMDSGAPFLRRPHRALESAREAARLDPDSDDTLWVLVRAETDCLHFDQAEDLASTVVDAEGVLTPPGRMLGDWVRDKARRARLDGLH